jgi:hypothetical protein
MCDVPHASKDGYRNHFDMHFRQRLLQQIEASMLRSPARRSRMLPDPRAIVSPEA